jgi:hypothetical protein
VAIVAIIVPNESEILQLDTLRSNLLDAGLLRLYQNDYTPDEDSTFEDFTEADYDGYDGSETPTWSSAATDGTGRAFTQSEIIQYGHDGGSPTNTIYGYFFTDISDNLLFAERFAVPQEMEDSHPFNLQVTYRLREDS